MLDKNSKIEIYSISFVLINFISENLNTYLKITKNDTIFAIIGIPKYKIAFLCSSISNFINLYKYNIKIKILFPNTIDCNLYELLTSNISILFNELIHIDILILSASVPNKIIQ